MKNLNEDIQILSELIRKANDLINPEDSLAYLQKKDVRDRLYGSHPKCFMKLKPIGQDTSPYLLPICNRSAIEDPRVIQMSLKMIEKLMTDKADMFDNNDVQKVLNALNHKNNTLSKQIPKPSTMAGQKSRMTRMFSRIKQHLNSINNRNAE